MQHLLINGPRLQCSTMIGREPDVEAPSLQRGWAKQASSFKTARGLIRDRPSRRRRYLRQPTQWSNRLSFAAVHESASGTKRTCQSLSAMSAFGGKADIVFLGLNVCLWPKADICHRVLLWCTIRSPLVGCDARSSGIREAASIHLATGRRCCGLVVRRACAPARASLYWRAGLAIEHAIRLGSWLSSVRYRRQRERDDEGRYLWWDSDSRLSEPDRKQHHKADGDKVTHSNPVFPGNGVASGAVQCCAMANSYSPS